MNIVQSFWSKPSFHAIQNHNRSRAKGGWLEEKYLWLSTAFSCYSSKANCSKVSLVTDSNGYEVLISRLCLPYDDVSTALDALRDEDHRLWVLGKLAALKMQREPFLHLDNDAYLWAPVSFNAKQVFLIAQSRINITEGYRDTLKDVFDLFPYIPDAIRRRSVPDQVSVINTGVIGGSDLEFFQEYCAVAEQFLYKNKEALPKVNVGMFMTLLSEYLLTCLIEEKDKQVSFLIDVPVEDSFKASMRFNLVPFLDKYIHLIGEAKKNLYACEQLAFRFQYEFPEEYKTINRVLQEMCPSEPAAHLFDNPDRWERAKSAFAVLYATNLESLLHKKVQLPEHVQVKEQTGENSEAEYKIEIFNKPGEKISSWKLEEMDEALVYFKSPVCINELLEGLKAEGFIYNEESLAQYRFKLIDFVTEKITIDGILEFA